MPDSPDDMTARKRRLVFRANHRGTREADLMLGGFVERCAPALDDAEVVWLEQLLEVSDVDIMSWITRSKPCPATYDTELMHAMQKLDYIPIIS